MNITDFLLARIAEDEAVARAASIPEHSAPNAHWPHPELARWWPPRVLAECAAKRRLVGLHREDGAPGHRYCDMCTYDYDGYPWPCPTIVTLASVYADHPDFREEWRP